MIYLHDRLQAIGKIGRSTLLARFAFQALTQSGNRAFNHGLDDEVTTQAKRAQLPLSDRIEGPRRRVQIDDVLLAAAW